MIDPTRPLTEGVRDALRASAALAAIVGKRVYSTVSRDAKFPYVVHRVDEVTPYRGAANLFDCVVDVDIYPLAKGSAETIDIKAAVVAALDTHLTIGDCQVEVHELASAYDSTDQDGVYISTVSFHYIVQVPWEDED